jgi:hypothetical protein
VVVYWRIKTDIGKIEIERDKDPFFCLRGVKYSWIRVAS